MTLHKSIGTLSYETPVLRVPSVGGGFDLVESYKLTVAVDPGIYMFYRSLIPKYYKVSPQKFPPHISVVRKEIPLRRDLWGKYDGDKLEFLYDVDIQNDENYWWLNTFSNRLEEIRMELGLPVSSPYTLPPSGFLKCFHMTIGNTKPLPPQFKA